MALYLDPITHPGAWNRVAFPTARMITPGKCVVNEWHRENEYDVKTGKGTAGATETLKGQPPAKGSVDFWAWTPEQFAAWTPILDLLRFDPSKGGNTTSTAGAQTTPTGSKGQTFGSAPVKNPGDGSASSASAVDTAASTDSSATTTKDKSDAQPALSAAYAIEVFHPALADIGVHYVLPPEKLGTWVQDGDGTALYKRTIELIEFTQPPNKSIAATPTGAGKTDPGATYAGTQEGSAADGASDNAKGAASDAQGAHGL